MSWEADVTRPYVEALEARGIPHVLVGGRAFHEREEVEAIRAALTAIEWPDDELSVFATLRGPFFAIGDEELLEWAHHFGRRTGDRFNRGDLPSVSRAAGVRREHAGRDRAPPADRRSAVAAAAAAPAPQLRAQGRRARLPAGCRSGTSGGVSGTLQELLAATRAHVGFALRTGGEQALANVLHIAELARQYEMGGGISFRGFVEELRVAAETAQASEAPILEEDSDGVRMMTVHKAKGLEFPDRHPRRPDVQALAPGGGPLDRSGRQAVRAEARRLGADRSPAARPRGSGARQGGRRAARVRRRHARA